jgi:methionyl aminopeptidase
MELRAGMVICIEALVCEGDPEVDNVTEWETEMSDGKKFLQFEHTILVTKDGYEVLTPFEV